MRKTAPTGDLKRLREKAGDTTLVVDHDGAHFTLRLVATPQLLFTGRYQVVDAFITGYLWGRVEAEQERV